MKVGLYLHNYTPVSGGGYSFQREVLRAISELSCISGHEFFLLAHPNEDILKKTSFPSAMEVVSIEAQPAGSEQPSFSKRLKWFGPKPKRIDPPLPVAQRISAFDYTVQKNDIEFVWFLTPAYELTNVPYIATVWDLQHRLQPWFPEVGNYVEWNGRETYIATYLQRATFIIVPNEAGKQEVHLFYQIPKERIFCLPHPAPQLAPVSPKEEQDVLCEYGLEPGFLFYPAQYWSHKNHAGLLYALRLLKEKYRLFPRVVFVGSDKGNLSYLKSLSSILGVQQQVHFLGFVMDNEMTVFYKNALALVYPSFFGPENLPPLEAFSMGCPVIASHVSGAIEQLGEAALLVDPASTDEIALAIKSLLENKALSQKLTSYGFERVKTANSFDYVKQVFFLLDKFATVRRAWGKSSI